MPNPKPKTQRKARKHYAIMSPYLEIGQVGCTSGANTSEAMDNVEDKRYHVKQILVRDCACCREYGEARAQRRKG